MMPAPGRQKPMPYLLLMLSRKLKTSLLFSKCVLQVLLGADTRLDQVVAVHRAGHSHLGLARWC
jgi:hypothetical protein